MAIDVKPAGRSPHLTMAECAESGLESALRERRWRDAHAQGLARLARDPQDAAALSALARIAEAHGNIAQAEALLARATAAAPADVELGARRARLLTLLSRFGEAADLAQAVLAQAPDDGAVLDALGVTLARAGRDVLALDAFAAAVQRRPDDGGGWRNYAGALRAAGRFEAAEAACDRALAADPADARAWLAKVGLRRQTPRADPTPTLRALWEARGPDPDTSLRLGHALAKTAEDLGRRDDAMAWLARAKADKARAVAHDPDSTDRLYAAAAEARLADGPGRVGPSPLFVVGAPRTGTTLVERILSSHPDIRPVGESPALSLALKRLAGTRTEQVLDAPTLAAAGAVTPHALADAYLREVAGDSGGRTVDKTPLNLLYARLVLQALPDARVVRLRRQPMDVVLANWRQLFAPRFGHYDHNWSLPHLARWVVAVERLAATWRAELPADRYLEIDYEEVVTDTNTAVARLLAFCDLDPNTRCLAFWENAAPVSTASAVQVRERPHARSVGAWRQVEPWLAPAAGILREAGLT